MCEASRSTDVQRSIINICSYSHAAGGIAGIAGWLANYTGQEYTHTHDHHDHNDRHPLTHPPPPPPPFPPIIPRYGIDSPMLP